MHVRQRGAILLTLALLAVLGLGACAAAGTGAAGNTTLVVENNLIPSASLTVYAVPDVGVRNLVGTVTPGDTARLDFNVTGVGGTYRFVAETATGAEIVSNPVTLTSGATIRWDLSSNIATVVEG